MSDFKQPDGLREAIERATVDPETGEILDGEDEPIDSGEQDESSPEPEVEQPEQPAALTDAKAEAIFASLDRYKASVAREVEKRADVLFGDLEPCPLCMGGGPAPGFFFPQLPEPEQSLRRMAIVQALGGDGEPDYKADEQTETCQRCDGYGKVRTGSKAQGQETRACPDCNGQGWKTIIAAPPVFTTLPTPATANEVWVPQPFGNGAADPWGRPVGHPHYGQNPALIGV